MLPANVSFSLFGG